MSSKSPDDRQEAKGKGQAATGQGQAQPVRAPLVGAPEDAGAGVAGTSPARTGARDGDLVTIYLREGAEPFLDSQTHLWVTGTKADPQRVPRAKVGEGCRRSADVVIEQE